MGKAARVEPARHGTMAARKVAIANPIGAPVSTAYIGIVKPGLRRNGEPCLEARKCCKLPAAQNAVYECIGISQPSPALAEWQLIQAAEGETVADVVHGEAAFIALVIVVLS